MCSGDLNTAKILPFIMAFRVIDLDVELVPTFGYDPRTGL